MSDSEKFKQHAVNFATLVHETDKAYLLNFGDDVETWIPKSQVKNAEEFEDEMFVVLPQWLIEEKGLEGYIEDEDVG